MLSHLFQRAEVSDVRGEHLRPKGAVFRQALQHVWRKIFGRHRSPAQPTVRSKAFAFATRGRAEAGCGDLFLALEDLLSVVAEAEEVEEPRVRSLVCRQVL